MGDGDYLEGQVEVRKETRRKSVLSEKGVERKNRCLILYDQDVLKAVLLAKTLEKLLRAS